MGLTFQRRSSEKIVKTIILQDTFISGTPVYAGEVLDLEESVFHQLHEIISRDPSGSETRRAVRHKDATPEQLALVKQREKKQPAHA
jgi:hypothetical protein